LVTCKITTGSSPTAKAGFEVAAATASWPGRQVAGVALCEADTLLAAVALGVVVAVLAVDEGTLAVCVAELGGTVLLGAFDGLDEAPAAGVDPPWECSTHAVSPISTTREPSNAMRRRQ
jgi:hypothetical protein